MLVGDACQAVSLLAGQGASLAVAGARVLSNHLARSASIAEGLAAYEDSWMPVAREKQEAGRRAARWFLPSSRAELVLRRLVLKLSRLPLTNRFISGSLTGKAAGIS